MINQICISPLDTRSSLIEYCKKENIQLMCYAPLMMMNHPKIAKSVIFQNLSQKYKTPIGQLILAWNHAKGIIPIPKSTKHERLIQNFNASSIQLTAKEVSLIDSLNEDIQYLPESIYCPGI